MKLRTLYITSLLPVASAALVIVGCDDTRRHSVGRPAVEAERTTGQKVDDKEIAGRVKSALDDNVAYKFPDVEVNVYEGTVQLSGFVATREQKSKAEDIVKAVTSGVKVENKISVKD
jgi:hyperosmotically inducible protein